MVTTLQKIALGAAVAALAGALAYRAAGWRPEPAVSPTALPTAPAAATPADAPPEPATAPAGAPAPRPAAEEPKPGADTDALQAERVAWLLRKLHARTLSPLDLQYGAARLRAALADETACRLYREYLAGLAGDPDNRRMLALALRALAQANPAAYAQALRDAVRDGDAGLAGAALASADLAGVPDPELLELAKRAAALGDPYVASNALRVADARPGEEARALLREVYARPGDAGVQSRAFAGLSRQAGPGLDADWDLFADRSTNGRTAEQRYLGMVHLATAGASTAAAQGDAASRIRSACDTLPAIGAALVDRLNDPDPLVRWAAARYYESFARDLDETARSVQAAGSLEAAAGRH